MYIYRKRAKFVILPSHPWVILGGLLGNPLVPLRIYHLFRFSLVLFI